jgi:hypothetical protein
MGKFLLWIIRVGWSVGAVLFFAFVMATLWTWFAVPAGAPSLSTAHVYGLSLLLTTPLAGLALVGIMQLDEEKSLVATVTVPVIYAISLGLGWVAKWFMT